MRAVLSSRMSRRLRLCGSGLLGETFTSEPCGSVMRTDTLTESRRLLPIFWELPRCRGFGYGAEGEVFREAVMIVSIRTQASGRPLCVCCSLRRHSGGTNPCAP
jgi:hypothetical protein